MVEYENKVWDGVVVGGELAGYAVEVRRQSFPWALYLLAFSPPSASDETLIGFAVGREQLAGHLSALDVEVTWEDGRGPLAPLRDRSVPRLPRRRRRRRRPVHAHLRPMGIGAGLSTARVA